MDMKRLTDKFLKAIIGMIAFAALALLAPQSLRAQSFSPKLTDKQIPVSEFNSLNVSDDFEVTLARGAYGVRLTVDEELAPYVEVYVKAKTLYLSYDEKSVPKELRKLYKGRNGLTPVFRVTASFTRPSSCAAMVFLSVPASRAAWRTFFSVDALMLVSSFFFILFFLPFSGHTIIANY